MPGNGFQVKFRRANLLFQSLASSGSPNYPKYSPTSRASSYTPYQRHHNVKANWGLHTRKGFSSSSIHACSESYVNNDCRVNHRITSSEVTLTRQHISIPSDYQHAISKQLPCSLLATSASVNSLPPQIRFSRFIRSQLGYISG